MAIFIESDPKSMPITLACDSHTNAAKIDKTTTKLMKSMSKNDVFDAPYLYICENISDLLYPVDARSSNHTEKLMISFSRKPYVSLQVEQVPVNIFQCCI